MDVTVSHPSQAIILNCDGEAQATSSSACAALDKVALKNNKYRTQCETHGVAFMAAVVCCFGGWLPDGEGLVNDLAERCAVRSGAQVAIVKGQFWQRLSLALWKGNASQILHYTG